MSITFLMIILSGCGGSGITATGDNATITTTSETNNAQAIVDTDINADVNVTNDKSTVNDGNLSDDNASGVDTESNVKDSYNKTHTNVLTFYNDKNSIIYNLNKDYSFIKFNLSVMHDANLNKKGVLQIKADDEIVYTSPVLTKTTKLIIEDNISINNCSLLTIEYNKSSSGRNPCIMSDIIVYNLE